MAVGFKIVTHYDSSLFSRFHVNRYCESVLLFCLGVLLDRKPESYVTPTLREELLTFYMEVKPDNVDKVNDRFSHDI